MGYDLQMESHADRTIWPEWGGEIRGDMIRPHWAHPGEDMGQVIGLDPKTGKDRIYQIVRCAWCISTHVWPLPDPAVLKAYYDREFYEVDKPDYLDRYEQDRKWWEECVHRPLLCKAVALLERGPRRRHDPVQVLEIGAGPGIALDVAKQQGWETWAIEPSRLCAEQLCRQQGHNVIHASLEDIRASTPLLDNRRGVDVIYLYEVLEHQPCPEDFLLRCYNLMAPGGCLVVAVPNDGNPLQYQVCEKLGIAPYWYAPPQHLFYFTPKTLQLLVRRTGFTICDLRGTYPMERFILEENQNYLGNDTIGRKVHQWRMQDELFALRSGLWSGREQQYRRQLEEKRWGREVYCIAQKPLES